MAADILIVDDEADIRELIARHSRGRGLRARGCRATATAALAAIARRAGRTLVVLDIWLQGSRLDGLELLDVIKREHPDVPVVMISRPRQHRDRRRRRSSSGAYDFIEKPFKADRLLLVVDRAIEASRLRARTTSCGAAPAATTI